MAINQDLAANGLQKLLILLGLLIASPLLLTLSFKALKLYKSLLRLRYLTLHLQRRLDCCRVNPETLEIS